MVKIKADDELRQRFLKALAENRKMPREGIHVSDLVYCLREAYFNRVSPQPPTETQLGFFVDGARRHEALQALGIGVSEAAVERFGVHGRVDILNEVPIELKSTRARQGVPNHYVRQLAYYCVLTMQHVGFLVIQRLLPGAQPWEFWRVEFNIDDIDAYENDLQYNRDLLRDALDRNDPGSLSRLCDEDAWKCRNCQHRQKCEDV